MMPDLRPGRNTSVLHGRARVVFPVRRSRFRGARQAPWKGFQFEEAGLKFRMSNGRVVSDLPDLTGVSLAELPALDGPRVDVVLEQVLDHSDDQNQEQRD